jgi:glycosyltransferase involved in cell wall biosynthesis
MHQTKLLQALVQLCENELLRKSMGQVGHERVQHLYKIENVMNDYQKVYEKAISIWQASVLN